MRKYFNFNGLFFAGQHGFRASHSCESALHELISNCLERLDSKDKTSGLNYINLMLFIDFKKAFDMIDSKLLLVKLCNYGFSNAAISMVEDYFYKRKQCVKIGNRLASYSDITLGVPQRSVLGPLLFLIFINDLPAHLSDINAKLFADDTTLLFSATTVEKCVQQCKTGVARISEWCEYNRLYINWTKTFLMFVSNRRNLEQLKSIDVDGTEILVVQTFRLLGVTLDTKLSFVKHASNIALTRRKMFALKRIYYLSFEVRVHFLKTFFFLVSTNAYH